MSSLKKFLLKCTQIAWKITVAGWNCWDTRGLQFYPKCNPSHALFTDCAIMYMSFYVSKYSNFWGTPLSLRSYLIPIIVILNHCIGTKILLTYRTRLRNVPQSSLIFGFICMTLPLYKVTPRIKNFTVLNFTRHFYFLFFLIGIHTMQGWTAPTRHDKKKKSTKKITGYRKSV